VIAESQWRCAACGDNVPASKAPSWIVATDQPLRGTKIAVCPSCCRSRRPNAAYREKVGVNRAQDIEPAPRHAPIPPGVVQALSPRNNTSPQVEAALELL
jgi:hypothetical protein